MFYRINLGFWADISRDSEGMSTPMGCFLVKYFDYIFTQARNIMTTDTQTLTIDGVEYNAAELSNNAKSQIMNLRVVDQEISSLQQKLAIAQTARAAYANALKSELPAKG
jgi:hypothetical protein